MKKKKHVLVLRTCDKYLRAHGGFQWPDSGPVEAPDWNPKPVCGGGLHGALWGEGNGGLFNWCTDPKWLVVKVPAETIVDLGGKVKFPKGEVVHVGDRITATDYILGNGATGKSVIGSTLTGGDRSTLTGGDGSTLTGGHGSTLTGGYGSTLTGGDRSTLTGGHGSTLTGGDRSTLTGGDGSTLTGGHGSTLTGGYGSTLTGGDRSTLTGGHGSTLTGGDGSTLTGGDGSTLTGGDGCVIAIKYWNGKRYKARIGHVKDEDGDGELEPNTPYIINQAGEFKVKP